MNYYRKPINRVIDDVKLEMQLSALTLKLSENNKKIDDLIGVDKNIKKDVSSNISKITNIENNLIIVNDIYNETFNISRFSVTYKDDRIFFRTIYSNFTTNGIIKINAKYNYVYDKNYTLRHVYRFYNNRRQFKKLY